MPGVAGGSMPGMGSAESGKRCRGELATWGGWASPPPLASGPARLPAARSAPRTGPHGEPAATTPASWRRANASGHERQGDEAKPRLNR